jgi:hypothetical protein
MNPYYFAKAATQTLIPFADKYLELVGFGKFLETLEPNNNLLQEIRSFERHSLRGSE